MSSGFGAGAAFSSSFLRKLTTLLIALIQIKIQKAINKKLMRLERNDPYLILILLILRVNSVISDGILMIADNTGMIISYTRDVTTAVIAVPKMTPTAMSMTLPLNANSLNSFHSFFMLCLSYI